MELCGGVVICEVPLLVTPGVKDCGQERSPQQRLLLLQFTPGIPRHFDVKLFKFAIFPFSMVFKGLSDM